LRQKERQQCAQIWDPDIKVIRQAFQESIEMVKTQIKLLAQRLTKSQLQLDDLQVEQEKTNTISIDNKKIEIGLLSFLDRLFSWGPRKMLKYANGTELRKCRDPPFEYVPKVLSYKG
jgi:hypothetical protein